MNSAAKNHSAVKMFTAAGQKDSLTMDFVLKNRKLLEHLKKCKVFLSKSMRDNIFKKYVKNKKGFGKTKASYTQTSTHTTQNKAAQLPKKKNFFIRLPSLPIKKNQPKAQKQRRVSDGGVLNKSKLIRKFGKRVFQCRIIVRRLTAADPLFRKKLSTNRKSVSFLETVEIFGENDIIYESDSDASMSPPRTSTPVKHLKKKEKKIKMTEKKEKNIKMVEKKEIKKVAKNQQKTKDTIKKRNSAATSGKNPSPNKKVRKSPSSPNKTSKSTDQKLSQRECFVKLNRSSGNVSLTSETNNTREENISDSHRIENCQSDESAHIKDTLNKSNSDNENVDGSNEERHEDDEPSLLLKDNESEEKRLEDDEPSLMLKDDESEDGDNLNNTEKKQNNRTGRADSDEDNIDREDVPLQQQDNIDQTNLNVAGHNSNSTADLTNISKGDRSKSTTSPSSQQIICISNGEVDLNETSDISETRIPTPLRIESESFESVDQNKHRAISASPVLSPPKTNGATTNKTLPSKLAADSPADLFDLLKSDKLPDQSVRDIPSPSREPTDEEDEAAGGDILGPKRKAPSPVPDLFDDSTSAHDTSKFSLNTFFKKVKDKLLPKKQDDASSLNESVLVDTDD